MSERLRLLIVDDSQDDATCLVYELKRGGFDPIFERVFTREAITAALNRRVWDLVITGHNLTQITSLDVLALSKSIDNDIPVIVVSGRIGEESAVDAMRAGAQDYIVKDNIQRLIPSIKRELMESKLRHKRRLAQATVRYLAYHDCLTGLVNRHEFENRLRQALIFAQKRGVHHALLYMDLDQFKIVNDTCGHAAGDEMLRQLSVLLSKFVRKEDTLARLGGDEFAVLLLNCPLERAEKIAANILHSIENFRLEWQNKTFAVGISIGVIDINQASRDIENVLGLADTACYAAKEQGRNQISVHPTGDSKISRRCGEIYWASRINHSLKENRFFLNWQAILPLNTGAAGSTNHEFLLRLRNESGEIVFPGDFIPVAERYNLMPELDRLVIEKAFSYLAKTEANQDKSQETKTYFINLSGKSLSDRTFLDDISRKIDEYGISPKLVCFEISEAVAISSLAHATEFIKGVKRQGCLFALDSFGTGLSSLSHLKYLPVDFIKIDGSYIRNIADDITDYSIVEAINHIGHANGIKTIAEYVETKQILEKVKEVGLDYAQGYEIEYPSVLPAAITS
jgi:diguanylate cyclase (GGDEF)-like protein